MNLYKVSYHTAHDGLQLRWGSSLREANAIRRALVQAYGPAMGSDAIEAVIIHTNKAGLLAWLNTHFNTDNG